MDLKKGIYLLPIQNFPSLSSSLQQHPGVQAVNASRGCGTEAGELLLTVCFTKNKFCPLTVKLSMEQGLLPVNVSERWSGAGKWCCDDFSTDCFLLAQIML